MLDPDRLAAIESALISAVELLPLEQSFAKVSVPVNVPSMARRIVGDILGWPLHLRNKGSPDDPDFANFPSSGSQQVMPIMRHKPNGVVLLDPRKRPPRPPKQKQAEEEPMHHVTEQVHAESNDRVGAAVRKDFDGNIYSGTVAKVDEFNGEKFYLVIYDDGNQEHMTSDDLAQYLVA